MKSVLIVEPDEPLAALLELVLQEDGYTITLAHNLDEARDILCRSHFDAIITEAFNQGNLFSFDPRFLSDLQAAAGNTPIVLCSTDTYALGLRTGDFGLADVISKPLDIDDLPRKMRKVTG
ncbi:MAG: response regulator [Chloroflexota bacterium]|nr:MAG: response regulator [Chloroflexota bacterium]